MKRIHSSALYGFGMIALAALAQLGLAASPKTTPMKPPTMYVAVSALPSCYNETDKGIIMCAEKFSDGSSAAGVPVSVTALDGTTIVAGALDSRGEIEFKAPIGAYTIAFADGAGSRVTSDMVHKLMTFESGGGGTHHR